MYGQPMYGAGPMYGMYGFPPGAAGEAGQARGWQQEREPAPVKFTEGKLFIGGVDAHTITKDELVQYCTRWGEVSDAVVMDKKNYGFVTFADPKNAMKFLETRVHELKGRKLDAKAAVPKAHLGTAKLTKKMFVGGTGDLTDEDFKEHFAQFGEIEDAAVVRREGMSRGFGFVTFADEISVEKCLLVNHYIKGRKVELKRAVPKEDLGAAAAAAAAGGGGLPAIPGMIPGAYPHPQQLYAYPYPATPFPGPMRPPGGYPGGPTGAPMQALGPMPHDPYAAWYGMGYMPYPYPPHPAAGMYPYGMVPQPGVPPYAGMGPFVGQPPGMTPAAAAAAAAAAGAPGARLAMGAPSAAAPPAVPPSGLQQEPPFLQTGRPAGSRSHGQPAGSSSSRGPSPAGVAPRTGSEAAGSEAATAAGGKTEVGSTSAASPQQQQQQQRDLHAVSPAGPATSSPEAAAAAGQAGVSAVRPGQATELSPTTGSSPSRPEGQKQPQLHGAVAAVAAAASAPAAAGMMGGLPGQQQGMQPAAGTSAGSGRRPVVMAYPMVPGFVAHPQPLPLPPRAIMGAAGMQQGQMQPGAVVPGAPGVRMPPGFVAGPRGGAAGGGRDVSPTPGGPSAGKS